MRPLSPWRLIGIAGALEVVGVVLPMLMVVGVLPSTWLLNISAFASSLTGLFIGSLGVTMYVQIHKKR